LGLALDEPKVDHDKVYEFAPLKLIIDGSLQAELGEVSVDYSDSVWRSGFKITSSKPLGGGGSGKCC
jgi:Fe-S cluster assembly iron-binding protein IscA